MPRSNEKVAKRSCRIHPSTMNTTLQPTTMAPSTPGRATPRAPPRPVESVRRPRPRAPEPRSRLRSCQERRPRTVSAGAGGHGAASTLGASMGLFNKILHAGEGRKLKSLESIAPVVGGHEPEMEARSDDELRSLTGSWREQLDQIDDLDKKQEHLDGLLPEAFAAVREAGRRTLGQ